MKSLSLNSTTLLLASCLAAGAALAQTNSTGNPGNTNSTNSTNSTTTNSGSAGNSSTRNSANPGTAKLSKADAAFLKQAAENGHAEVESSKIALQKVKADDPVRRFAQMMVEDHERAGAELKALATSKGVEVSDQPSVVQRGKIKLLSTSDGENFSRRYIDSMGVTAHKDTVALFEKAASRADDAEVKAFATKTLPTLKEHMAKAQELHASHQGMKGERQGDAKKAASNNGTR